MVIKNLSTLFEIARKKPVQKLVVAAAEGEHVLKAAVKAKNESIIKPIFIGSIILPMHANLSEI